MCINHIYSDASNNSKSLQSIDCKCGQCDLNCVMGFRNYFDIVSNIVQKIIFIRIYCVPKVYHNPSKMLEFF